jgi:hypothetical protein
VRSVVDGGVWVLVCLADFKSVWSAISGPVGSIPTRLRHFCRSKPARPGCLLAAGPELLFAGQFGVGATKVDGLDFRDIITQSFDDTFTGFKGDHSG